MKIYVAGSSHEIPRVRAFQEALCAAGHRITHDWTKDVEQYREQGSDANTSFPVLFGNARRNIAGVIEAGLLIALSPIQASTGLGFELGMAIGISRFAKGVIETWWVGAGQSCFWTQADCIFPTDDDAIQALQILDRRLNTLPSVRLPPPPMSER